MECDPHLARVCVLLTWDKKWEWICGKRETPLLRKLHLSLFLASKQITLVAVLESRRLIAQAFSISSCLSPAKPDTRPNRSLLILWAAEDLLDALRLLKQNDSAEIQPNIVILPLGENSAYIVAPSYLFCYFAELLISDLLLQLQSWVDCTRHGIRSLSPCNLILMEREGRLYKMAAS